MLSIIIPHRNRHKRLEYCLQSIAESQIATGIDDYEVVVVDLNSLEGEAANPLYLFGRGGHKPTREQHAFIKPTRVAIHTPDNGFNKCRALNHGLDVARGSTITFLDADAIVGPLWLEGVRHLDEDPAIVRLCYRVHQLPETSMDLLARDWDTSIATGFRKFNNGEFNLAFEAYYQPNNKYRGKGPAWPDLPEARGPHVFGNSQFSMRREDIGDLRFEAALFPQAGHEDLDFIAQVHAKFGDRYDALILRDGPHAMFHIEGCPVPGRVAEPDWYDPAIANAQERLYVGRWGTTRTATRKGSRK